MGSYRQKLANVDNELRAEDLENLKFLCAPSIKQGKKLKSIENARELFELFEQQSLVSEQNLDYLFELLCIIERPDLAHDVLGYEDDYSTQRQLVCPFRSMLVLIGDNLDSSEVHRLRFLYGKIGQRNNVTTGLDLFIHMIQRRDLGPDELKPLINILKSIDRQDLQQTVLDFQNEFIRDGVYTWEPSRSLSRPVSGLSAASFSGLSDREQSLENMAKSSSASSLCSTNTSDTGRSDTGRSDMTSLSETTGTLTPPPDTCNRQTENQNHTANLTPTNLLTPVTNQIPVFQHPWPCAASGTYDTYNVNIPVHLGSAKEVSSNDETDSHPIQRPVQETKAKSSTENAQKSVSKPSNEHFYPQPELGLEGQLMLSSQTTCTGMGDAQSFEIGLKLWDSTSAQLTARHKFSRETTDETIPKCVDTLFVAYAEEVETQTSIPWEALARGLSKVNLEPAAGGGDGPKYYKMDAKPRGHCVIINNSVFTYDPNDPMASHLGDRKGSDIDADRLKSSFQRLEFTTTVHNNLTNEQMLDVLRAMSASDHTSLDCFVCCVLTHGGDGYVYGRNGRKVLVRDLTGFFRSRACPSLAGKPKLFFLACCQGKRNQEGQNAAVEQDGPDDGVPRWIPNEADFLLGYATVPGYVSYRSVSRGTWYITELTKALDEHGHSMGLLHLLIHVNDKVSEYYHTVVTETQETIVCTQVPAPQMTLTADIKFL